MELSAQFSIFLSVWGAWEVQDSIKTTQAFPRTWGRDDPQQSSGPARIYIYTLQTLILWTRPDPCCRCPGCKVTMYGERRTNTKLAPKDEKWSIWGMFCSPAGASWTRSPDRREGLMDGRAGDKWHWDNDHWAAGAVGVSRKNPKINEQRKWNKQWKRKKRRNGKSSIMFILR